MLARLIESKDSSAALTGGFCRNLKSAARGPESVGVCSPGIPRNIRTFGDRIDGTGALQGQALRRGPADCGIRRLEAIIPKF
jgi:hypothetical protein